MRRDFAYFWDQRLPHVVKLDIERRTGTLLERTESRPLTYAGKRPGGRLELRLEASSLNGTLYSLRLDASRDGPKEAPFREWLRNLSVSDDPGEIEFAAGERYQHYVETALRFEAEQAQKVEDAKEIAAAQEAVLSALRAGRRYRRAEGGPEGFYTLEIQLEDGVLVKRESGDTLDSVHSYSTRGQILNFLRSFFLEAACRDTFPHKPPEAEIWKFIGYQLR